VLGGAEGRASLTSGQVLGTFLSDHRPLRLAVLNACEGGRSANDDPFAGVAQTLIQQGVPAVVAMQFEITDRAAIAFSDDFYASLVLGLPVDVAVNEARKSIYAQPNATEWATPVLYLRSPDGVLFELESAPTLPEPQATDSAGAISQSTQPAAAADLDAATTAEREREIYRDAPVAPPLHSRTEALASEDTRFVVQPATRDISEAPQFQSLLEPLRRTPTLLLLGFAMLALGLFWFFQARYFDTTNPQYLKAGDYARPFGWGLGALAAYLGAYWVGRSASGASPNSRLLLLGGASLTVGAFGSLTFAIGKHGSQDPTVLNISLGLQALGILLVGFLCFVLAERYRTSKVGPRGRSPFGPLLLAGIGIWLYTAEIYLSFSWVTNYNSNVAHGCYVLASLGLTALSGALVLTAVYRAGPVVRLLTAALALLILALATIVFAYSVTQNAQIDSASVICLSFVCLAIVFFVSPFLTRPFGRGANGDRKLLARA